jgi:DNA-binding response OmpR family regulator
VRLLIVEDEPDIADGLETALRRAGYMVDVEVDGEAGQEAAMLNSYGVILLDWMLPGRDGQTICKNLRSAGISTPVIMVTARDQVSDRVSGLDCGADDYLVKPFAIDELLARIRALTRRESAQRSSKLEVGPLVVDTLAKTVALNGEPVHLTQREYALAEALARNPGRVLTRDAILQRVWNNDEALPNTVSFHMKSLRRKVDPEGKLIHTVHGFGYTMRWEG